MIEGQAQASIIVLGMERSVRSWCSTLSLCLRASAWGVGLRRSTARTYRIKYQCSEDDEKLVVMLLLVACCNRGRLRSMQARQMLVKWMRLTILTMEKLRYAFETICGFDGMKSVLVGCR